jgi:hypothetical protein
MLPSKALEYARDLVASGWCQGVEARDQAGRPVEPWDPSAVAWSLIGAVVAIAHDAAGDAAFLEQVGLSTLALGTVTRSEELKDWNDEPRRTHEDVLRAYDAAAEMLPRLVAAQPKRQAARRGLARLGRRQAIDTTV